MLLCLRSEHDESVRNKIVDTICDIAIGSMERGRPWPELQSAAFECSQSPAHPLRQSAFKIFANVPQLILDQEISVAVNVLERGLQDPESVEV